MGQLGRAHRVEFRHDVPVSPPNSVSIHSPAAFLRHFLAVIWPKRPPWHRVYPSHPPTPQRGRMASVTKSIIPRVRLGRWEELESRKVRGGFITRLSEQRIRASGRPPPTF